MDPNATLRMIEDALRHPPANGADHLEIDGWCRDLGTWLDRGGFEPDWDAYPWGASYYHMRAEQGHKP